jgi:hypothetical protein
VRACPFEDEERGFNSVDEKPVWLDVAFSMVVPLTGECMVLVLGRQRCSGLKQVNDGFEFVEIVAPFLGKLEVFEKTAGGFEEKHDLDARTTSECAKVFERGEFLRMFRFFKRVPRVRVWDHERKRDTLVEFNLGIKETDGFGFRQAEAVKDFHGLLLQTGIDTRVDAVRHRYVSCFSHIPIVRHVSCE